MATQTRKINTSDKETGTGWQNPEYAYSQNASTMNQSTIQTVTSNSLFAPETSFSIPAGATISKLTITHMSYYMDYGYTAQIASALKVGGSYYNKTLFQPATTLTTYNEDWTTNPKTSVAWTVNDINGSGTNPLQMFGVRGYTQYQSSPQFYSVLLVDYVYAVVTYTEPATFQFGSGGGSGWINTPGNYAG